MRKGKRAKWAVQSEKEKKNKKEKVGSPLGQN
jgi:hypothetical protein